MQTSDPAGVRTPAVYAKHVNEAAEFIRPQLPAETRIALILGTGLGRLADEINASSIIEYDDIPHFPVSTVESHHGRLIVGTLGAVPVVAMQGRFHLYEGYDALEVTFPVRVLGQLGIETLLISNAAGGMNPAYRRADMMLVTDHINLQG
ncbi:MAG: purine-nucleoside phosphorylase, partial [Rhodothermales bacterium]|nr:purine-nucleoside phosphorylase [Rhodothermales bacterium]